MRSPTLAAEEKLPRLLKRYPVTLVHPTAEDRCIVKLATDPDVPAQVAEPRLALRGASIGKRLPASRTDHQVAAVYFDSSPATVLRSRTRAPFSTSGQGVVPFMTRVLIQRRG